MFQHVRANRPEASPALAARWAPGHPEGMAEENHSITLAFDAADEYRPEAPPPPEIPAWKDGSIRIGIHTSIAGDIQASLEIAHGLGANALQIFSSSPRMWDRGGMRIAETEAAAFSRAAQGTGPRPAGHPRQLSDQSRFAESGAAHAVGAGVSPGTRARDRAGRGLSGGASGQRPRKHAAGSGHRHCAGIEAGRARAEARRPENSAGKYRGAGHFDRLAIRRIARDYGCVAAICRWEFASIRRILLPRDGICAPPKGWRKTLQAIDRTVGLDRVFVVHVNDSKTHLGSRVDRHEHIGKGKIGLEAFGRILNHPLLAGARVHFGNADRQAGRRPAQRRGAVEACWGAW